MGIREREGEGSGVGSEGENGMSQIAGYAMQRLSVPCGRQRPFTQL